MTNEAPKKPSFPAVPFVVIITSLAMMVTTLSLTLGGRSKSKAPPADPFAEIRIPADLPLVFPDLALTDAAGAATSTAVLDGRYTVVDFFFTNCPFACPGMVVMMRRVQDGTPDHVALLSISVDGANDTPEIIRGYAERAGADPDRWTFTTGDPDAVAGVITTNLMMATGPDPSRVITLADGTEMANIEHPTRLLLVGPDRRVIATASYTSEHAVDRLIELVNGLAGDGDGGGEP